MTDALIGFELDEQQHKEMLEMMGGMTSAVVKKAMSPQTRAAAKKVLRSLQAKAPVGSGRLKKAVYVIEPEKQRYKNFVVYKAGVDLGTDRKDTSGAYYAWWVMEYGSRNHPARGVMSSTLREHSESAARSIMNKTWERISAEWKKGR